MINLLVISKNGFPCFSARKFRLLRLFIGVHQLGEILLPQKLKCHQGDNVYSDKIAREATDFIILFSHILYITIIIFIYHNIFLNLVHPLLYLVSECDGYFMFKYNFFHFKKFKFIYNNSCAFSSKHFFGLFLLFCFIDLNQTARFLKLKKKKKKMHVMHVTKIKIRVCVCNVCFRKNFIFKNCLVFLFFFGF